jgi:hypothetical protein
MARHPQARWWARTSDQRGLTLLCKPMHSPLDHHALHELYHVHSSPTRHADLCPPDRRYAHLSAIPHTGQDGRISTRHVERRCTPSCYAASGSASCAGRPTSTAVGSTRPRTHLRGSEKPRGGACAAGRERAGDGRARAHFNARTVPSGHARTEWPRTFTRVHGAGAGRRCYRRERPLVHKGRGLDQRGSA